MAPRKFLFKTAEEQKAWFMVKANNDFSNWEGKPAGNEAGYNWNELRDIIAQVNNITSQTLVELMAPIIRKAVVRSKAMITKEGKNQAKSEIVRMLINQREKMKPDPPTAYQTWLENAVDVYLRRAIHVYRHSTARERWGKAHSTTRKTNSDGKQPKQTRSVAKRDRSSAIEEDEEDEEEEEEHPKLKRRKSEERNNERVYIKISESPEPEQPLKAKSLGKPHENLNGIPEYSPAEFSSFLSHGSPSRHFESSAYSTPAPQSSPISQNILNKFNIKVELHSNLSEGPLQVLSIAAKLIVKSEYLRNNITDITAESLSYEKLMERLTRAPLFFKDDDQLGWIQPDVHPLSAAYCRITDEWDFINGLMLLQDIEQPIVLHIVRKPQPSTGATTFSNTIPSMPSPYTEPHDEGHSKLEPSSGRQRFVGNIFMGWTELLEITNSLANLRKDDVPR